MARDHDIEDVYPLSPLQQGLLFHTLEAPGSGVYFGQFTCLLEGKLDVDALEGAWRQAVDRHPVLRTAFFWEGLDDPVQVVFARTTVPFAGEDWRDLSSEEQDRRLDTYLRVNAESGFVLSEAPLMRLALFRLADETYRLVWSHHHLLLDGWSVSLLIAEIFASYGSIAQGEAFHLAQPRPYRDYIEWLQRQDLTAAERFWREALAGFGSPTPLGNPAVRQEPVVRTDRRFRLSADDTAALRSFVAQHQLTLNTLVQGAWALLLAHHSGEADVVFGGVTSGRPASLPGAERMLGLFINTLPVRAEARGDARISDWLHDLQERQALVRRYEFSPLASVQRWSEVPPQRPLFESLLVFENYPVGEALREQVVSVEVRDLRFIGKTNYPLSVVVDPGRELQLRISYDQPRFAGAEILKLWDHFARLLAGIAAAPEGRLTDLARLSEAEHHQVLWAWNDSSSGATAAPRCLFELFSAQAARTPEAAAVRYEEEILTFAALDRASNRLGHHLRRLGVGPEVRVGIYLERSLDWVVSLLGVLKAGGCYVPLEPDSPPERLAYQLADSGASVVLTADRSAHDLVDFSGSLVRLDTDREAIGRERETAPVSRAVPENLAYVIYTSGSTGRPKGVGVEHRQLAHYLAGIAERLAAPPGASFALVSTFAADLGYTMILPALCGGGCLHVISGERMTDPDLLGEYFERHEIDYLKIVPSHFGALLSGRNGKRVLPRRMLVLGGEASTPSLIERIESTAPGCRILNHYGPTETTVGVSTYPLPAGWRGPSSSVPLGRPLAGSRLYVVDRGGVPVPPGAAGELLVGGGGVSRGYLNRGDLSAERFVPDSLSGEAGTRLYRTGDLVRHLADGSLEFLGRIDDQVKIRGFRVEPREIESLLAAHPEIRESAVVVREDATGERRLAAYVTSRGAESPSVAELVAYLRDRLPAAWVPASVRVLDFLPLTANGKLDRRALPAPEDSDSALGHGGHEEAGAPRTLIEELLSGLWAEILSAGRVGIDDDFFALGGHSLLATRVISRVRESFQVDLPLRALFEAPTVSRLALRIEAARRQGRGWESPPIERVDRDRELPLSFAQQRLWFLDQMEPNSAAYNIPRALHLSGVLEVESLRRSVEELVRRHETLRTTFAMAEGRPRQVIGRAGRVPLPMVDLAGVPEPEVESHRLAEVEAASPFDLARGPLLRARLLRLGTEEHRVLFTLHHIISDAWSREVMIREVAAQYGAFRTGLWSPLPELAVQYADYAIWQRQWLQGEVLAAHLDYWRRRLSGAPSVLELPTDRPRPAIQSFVGASRPLAVPRSLSESLSRLSRARGVTLFMTVLAGLQSLLARYSGQEDVSVGTPVAGRTRIETEGLIGFFVNTLVLRADLSADPSFEDLLAQVREASLDAYTHQELPFEKLVEELQPERSLSHSPLFQVMLAFESAATQILELPGLKVRNLGVERHTAKFDLSFFVTESEDGLATAVEYNIDLFEPTTIDRLLAHYQTLLEGIAAEPDERLSALSVLTRAERQQVLIDWNDNVSDYSRDLCIHECFALQVALRPGAPAVDSPTEQLTYAELDRRANRFARRLRATGVGPETLVGMYVERSPAVVVAMLGILKAGGAYLPLDPSWPVERLLFLLDDANVPVVVTQEHLAGDLPSLKSRLVVVLAHADADADGEAEVEALPYRAAVAESLAYVMYTSGSTGLPKGSRITHRGVVRLVQDGSFVALGFEQRLLLHSPLAFDASTFEIWGALLNGATLAVLPAGPPAVEDLAREVSRSGVTTLFLTTGLFHQVAEGAPDGFGTVRQLLTGGDVLSPTQVGKWLAGGGCRVVNCYGPTEGTTITSCHSVSELDARGASVPLGRPIANTRVYLLDRRFQPVPLGAVGELLVGGDGLARDYLERPDLTAERFIPDPVSGRPGERLYRTGDSARYLPDGRIQFLGRRDHQVKVRGFRIELGEIEAVLGRYPEIQEVLVVAREDVPGDRRLVAYAVAQAGAAPKPEELRRHLLERLPDYMVPSAFVFLERLPLTANGKIDRKALPRPSGERPDLEKRYSAPRTPVEQLLCEVWSQVLRVDRVGVEDNFFSLGGDSILSIQIVSRAHAAGLKLSPKQIFQHQTVAELAGVAGVAGSPEAGEAESTSGPVPLSPIQHWFFEHVTVDRHHFSQSLLFEVRTRLDFGILRETVSLLLAHHEALRSRFVQRDGARLELQAGGEKKVPATQIDLSGFSAERQPALIELAAAQVQTSLDLESGPMLRIVAFDLGAERPGRLLLAIHHLVIDGVSWRILLDDLQTTYRQLESGTAPRLPSKTTSVRRWRESLLRHARSTALLAEADYWCSSKRFAGSLPADGPGENRVAAVRGVAVELSEEETRLLLHDVPRAYRTRIQEVLLTAIVQAFASWTGSRSLVVDLEGHGREELGEEIDVSRTVGWFTTIFPVLLDLGDAQGAGESLKSIKEQMRRVPQNGLGYGLLRYLTDDRDISERLRAVPPASVSFNYLGQLDQALPQDSPFLPAAESAGPEHSPRQDRRYLLELNGRIWAGRLRMAWRYGEGVHRQATIEALAENFVVALRELIAHCTLPGALGYTPADFPLAGTDQPTLDRLAAETGEIEDLYPLAPLQQGLLFHTLEAPDSDVYFEQLTCSLEGDLDLEGFTRAWHEALGRHSILRTGFLWKGLEKPLQYVRARVGLPLRTLDWRRREAAEQIEALEELLEADRRQGFDPSTAPLLRLALIRTGARSWQLVWSFHHLLLDGWSLRMLMREIFILYEAVRAGDAPPIERPRPFRDYIVWLEHQDRASAEVFWRVRLAGFVAPTPLAVGSFGPGTGGKFGRRSVRLAEASALQELSRRHQLTLNTLTQAAWGLLLARYSGESDVVFGAVTSGRPASLPGVERMIGMFLNTLPVRVRNDDGAALTAWLKELQDQQVESRQYEHSPLTEIQRWSEVPRDQPLFQSLLVFESYPVGDLTENRGSGLEVRNYRFFERTNYPVTLLAVPIDGMSLSLSYDAAIFDAPTVGRMLVHLERLLGEIAAGPIRRPAELSLLSGAERHQLLSAWNDTRVAYEESCTCLHDLIRAQTARTPEACALVFEGRSLTYRELDLASDALARRLLALGVGPEARVGIFCERSLELVVGLLGTLKAGAAYVPLDPEYPKERLAFMLADSLVSVVLTEEGGSALLPELDPARVVFLDRSAQAVPSEAPLPSGGAAPENLAYVIYTSGSTGRPKGAMNTHAGIVNRLLWMQEAYGLSAEDRVLQKTPTSFDVSVWEFFWPLLIGARLVIAKPGGHRDPSYLVRLIAAEGVTTLHFVPSMLQIFLEAEGLETCASVRRVMASGEALSGQLAARFRERLDCPLYNLYGPTEAAVDVTHWPCRDDESSAGVPIGRPIANTGIFLLDRNFDPVPVAVPGELFIGGSGLARGYLNRPDLSAERFVPDPFAETPGGRLYRTGDLARFSPRGAVEYLGRLDHQVKLRGFRIELGEIEAVLEGHEHVRDAVVLVREDEPGDRRLVAYVTGARDAELDLGELRAHARRELPEYMVPAEIVLLQALPLNPNGKVDRRALPRPEGRPAAAAGSPRTPFEEILAAIWEQVLHVEGVGTDADFFDLGGHSILALQMISRVEKAFDVELPLRAVFESSILARLAERIEAARTSPSGPQAPPLVPIPRTGAMPVSFAQRQLWFLDQLQPDNTAYNLSAAIRLSGLLRRDVLRASLTAVELRHESLRTVFENLEGEPVQVVLDPQPLPLPEIDLDGLPGERREPEGRRLIDGVIREPFDLARGPLLRVSLLRLDVEEHVAVFTLHHIVSDGWSMGVLMREVASLYGAFSKGAPSPLLDLPVQYADYAHWQRAWLRGEALATRVAYWRAQLADAPPLLELPTDRPRPAVQSQKGGVLPFLLPSALSESLAALAAGRGATAFMALLAAFQVLLLRHSGQSDLSVGTPVAGRGRLETEDLIGLFVNTLVLRVDLSDRPTFSALLERVRELTLEAHAHQEVPFERVVEELAPERSLSHSPLFQVLFVLRDVPRRPLTMPDLVLRPVALRTGAVQFDLVLGLGRNREGFAGTLEYKTDLFDAPTIVRLMDHFERLAAAAVASPGRRISELALLSEGERHQLLVAWNDTTADLPGGESCLHDLVTAQAAKSPDTVAVAFEGECLTFGELASRAGHLAGHLRDLGVGPEVRVGLAAARSTSMLVGLLGILRAGGAYVPLDPDQPRERLARVLEDSDAAMVVSPEHLADRWPASIPRVSPDLEIATGAETPPAGSSGDHLAYVIYTSGSTGRPKGVMVRHGAIVNRLLWMQEEFPLGARDVVLQKTPLTFDASIWEVFLPLFMGARLELARPGGHRDSGYLVGHVQERGVTVLQLVPSQLRVFLDEPKVGECRSLRRLFCGGEALSQSLVELCSERLSASVCNLYGPTESSIDASFARCDGGERGPSGSVPIGRPLSNVRLYAVSAYGESVPRGASGELWIGGAGLARGYAGSPAGTAERFVPDGLSGLLGERLYRTGDRVRILGDGRIEYQGRLDQQVKVRGVRIEPAEVESALRRHPRVREAVVLTREDRDAGNRLLAFLVLEAKGPTAEELRSLLRLELPEAMVPSAFVTLERLPLLPNGKLDRRALAELETMPAAGRSTAPLRTPTEELVAEIWREVLGVEQVGGDENFFDLGGHSLLATRVISRLRTAFGVEVPLRGLFEAPTLSGLAATVDGLRDLPGAQAPPIVRRPRGGSLRLSFAQERLWFLDHLEPGSPAYNIPIALRLEGRLEIAVLERCWNALLSRHEPLRTVVRALDGEPVQVVLAAPAARLPRIDLVAFPSAQRDAAASRLALAEARRSFDLERGPLARVTLLRLAEEEHAVLLTLHHVISDGWSMGVLVREVATLYRAFCAGQAPELPELPIQYADFARWQRDWMSGEVLADFLAYWRVRLADAPPALDLPTDRPRPALPSGRGGLRTSVASTAIAAGLAALGRSEGVTLFMTLLAAFDTLLQRYTGRGDLVLGTDVANRNRAETENLIGFFVNQLVLRVDLSGDPTFRSLLPKVREVALGAYAHQDLPFERLVEELQPERDLSRQPVFQVSFVVQNLPAATLDLPGLTLRHLPLGGVTAKLDLTLVATETKEGLRLTAEYSTDLFDPTTVDRLLGHFESLLAGAVQAPDSRLSALPLLGAAERHQALVEWNDSASGDASFEACLPELFAARVAEAPEAVAASFKDQAMTYGELDRRARRLAGWLSAAGIQPDDVVALLADRSVEYLVAVVGVFYAGAAYLPLDPLHPVPRLAQMMERSDSPLVVAERRLAAPLAPRTEVRSRPRLLVLEELLAEEAPREVAPRRAIGINLAYVIYTSGSTGIPKGAMVAHRGMRNHLEAKIAALGLAASDIVAQTASQCFDISVWQFLASLVVGGRVHILPDEVAHDPLGLLEEVERCGITVLETVPSLLRLTLEELELRRADRPRLRHLRWMIPTGEALPPELCRHWLRLYPTVPLVNAYGPTECSDDVTHQIVRTGPALEVIQVPIGRPVVNTQLYVLGSGLSPQPIGVPGELYVGGLGVGRGYLHEGDRTADVWSPDPFTSRSVGARLYRTGDLARFRPDGAIEFLGRIDHQVKIRGHRIELGEIEAGLASHPAVQSVAVLVREDSPNERRLVAYVVPRSGGSTEEWDAGKVDRWQAVFDEVYSGASLSALDPGINLRVWISSYTGGPLPEPEILECVEDSVARLLAFAPVRVLEIGCGTGLLLTRIAPHCTSYCGTDVSAEVLRALRERIEKRADLAHVELIQAAADDLSGVADLGGFDLVIINEVVQYFPSVEYLVRVLRGAAAAVAPEGNLFVGGVRSLPLLETFHTSVHLQQAASDLPLVVLAEEVRRRMDDEKELAVDPELFAAIAPSLAATDLSIRLKGGRSKNELTKFRYDVTLQFKRPAESDFEAARFDWEAEGRSLAGLRRRLVRDEPQALRAEGMPNARLLEDLAAHDLVRRAELSTVGELRDAIGRIADSERVEPADLWDLGRELGYEVEIRWSGDGARLDALFVRPGVRLRSRVPQAGGETGWDRYANQPLRSVVAEGLVPQLRAFLAERLPEPMIPAAFVVLDALPLTPNGKLDRRALPAPDQARPDLGDAYVAPSGAMEEALAAIWTEVLRIDRVGARDNFFELGGHSLLATQVASRIWRTLGVKVPLRDLFAHTTISGLAAHLEELMLEKATAEDVDELLSLLEGMDEGEVSRVLASGEAVDPS